ncbi:MAG: PmoA family protein [Bacteroidia bacterium]|nr:PmoA family protein [Bacteroidia bacterium]
MKLIFVTTIVLFQLIYLSCFGQAIKPTRENPQVKFVSKPSENKVDVIVDDILFTSFCWPDNVYKPILYPVMTSSGTEVTRGFPLKPRAEERNDHIHQVGIWFNYGNVNGVDFWGNGSRGFREPGGGEIKHIAVDKLEPGTGEGVLKTRESWIAPKGKELLAEKTEYHFIASGNQRIIDRITTLTAGDTTVLFKDTKEGMFGIRLARQLELPSDEVVTLLDSSGKPSKEQIVSKTGVSGNYHSSEGLTGEAVWGTRAKWMALNGTIGNEEISIIICDHPQNQSYPTYWHARGYGLFAANPLGWSDFTKGKE